MLHLLNIQAFWNINNAVSAENKSNTTDQFLDMQMWLNWEINSMIFEQGKSDFPTELAFH